MIFYPITLSKGWRSVALARSGDKARPALTGIHVESHDAGIRVVATDSYMMLSAWIPNVEAERDFEPEPTIDAAPVATTTVLDPHGRGLGLLAHAAKLHQDDEIDEIRIQLGVSLSDESDAKPFDGMEVTWCVIEVADRERVKLPIYEGEFPQWRRLLAHHNAEETKQVLLNLELLGRLAKLPKLTGENGLAWTFGGANGAARVELVNSFPFVEGVVMPCRWDIDADRPAEDEAPDAGADEAEA